MFRILHAPIAKGLTLLWVVSAISAGCQPAVEPAPQPISNPLYLSPEARDFSANPALLERIMSSPHGYLRFINVPFSREVCRRFSDDLAGTPLFNLHGDAHIEQYAVTDIGRGLTDFDDSSTGPAILDLARFGVSMTLAAEQAGFSSATDTIFEEFLRGYRQALEDPTFLGDEPRLAKRKRAEFSFDKQAYFEFIDSLMEAVPADETADLETALIPYFDAMREDDSSLRPEFFDIVSVGYLRQGIGSALDVKYLIRTAGPSDSPLDDIVLEAKQVRDLTSISCINVGPGADPFRVLVGHARIATEPYRFLGYARLRGLSFWVHAWVENYSEIDIAEDFESADELAEVVFDVGLQLGRGHVRQIAAPLDQHLRREQLRLIERDGQKIKVACRELAAQIREAWQLFTAAVD